MCLSLIYVKQLYIYNWKTGEYFNFYFHKKIVGLDSLANKKRVFIFAFNNKYKILNLILISVENKYIFFE